MSLVEARISFVPFNNFGTYRTFSCFLYVDTMVTAKL